jgi:hypothetical protein
VGRSHLGRIDHPTTASRPRIFCLAATATGSNTQFHPEHLHDRRYFHDDENMKAWAVEFLTRPFRDQRLLDAIRQAPAARSRSARLSKAIDSAIAYVDVIRDVIRLAEG